MLKKYINIKVEIKNIIFDFIIPSSKTTLLEMYWLDEVKNGNELDTKIKVCKEIVEIAFKLFYFMKFNKVCQEEYSISTSIATLQDLPNYKHYQFDNNHNIFIQVRNNIIK